ncbi:MAG: alkaline phosphatase family protein [Marmoricola sp.]
MALLAGCAIGVVPLVGGSPARADDPATPVPAPEVPTTVRVASFNMLGASHTDGSHPRRGYATSAVRMGYAAQIIRSYGLDIVGMQEFQYPQWRAFEDQLGSTYDVYPGGDQNPGIKGVSQADASENSIAWNTTEWTALATQAEPIYYFGGRRNKVMSSVLLRNNTTGRELWVINSHPPADTAGNAQRWRDADVVLEKALVSRLEQDYPGVPVISVGDKNDKDRYICPVMSGTDLRPAAGGEVDGSRCTPPRNWTVDWVSGNSDVAFSGYTSLRTALVRRTTDHPVVFADATLPSAQVAAADISHVVVLDIPGLRSSALETTADGPGRMLRWLRAHGASTLNARTAGRSVSSLKNAVAIATSTLPGRRPVGFGSVSARRSLQHTAGRYVSSAFDVVHDRGLRTGFWTTSPALADVVGTAWVADGATDTVGLDDGRAKITARRSTRLDRAAMAALLTDLGRHRTTLSLLSLNAVDGVALQRGPRSSAYDVALRAVDRYVGTLVRAVRGSTTLAGHTAVIVTSDHGAVRRAHLRPGALAASRVPFFVWAPGVPAASDLYALNGSLTDPGSTVPPVGSTGQPLRNAEAANLATKLLGMPAVSGSTVDPGQTLTVFAP